MDFALSNALDFRGMNAVELAGVLGLLLMNALGHRQQRLQPIGHLTRFALKVPDDSSQVGAQFAGLGLSTLARSGCHLETLSKQRLFA
jgi:hypothetical protein